MALPPSHSGRVGPSLCFSLQGSHGMAEQPWHPPAGAKAFAHPTTISGVETCKFPMGKNSGPCSLPAFPTTVLGMSCACSRTPQEQDFPSQSLLKGSGKNKGLLRTVVLAHQQDLQCFLSAPQEWLPGSPLPP